MPCGAIRVMTYPPPALSLGRSRNMTDDPGPGTRRLPRRRRPLKTPTRSLRPEAPPNTLFGILGRLGPGLIVAGSIVGSGELIATTKTGAEAGFWLLWLILIGCVIKVFAQVEMGRYSLVGGKTTMFGLNEVPGARGGGLRSGDSKSSHGARQLDGVVLVPDVVRQHRSTRRHRRRCGTVLAISLPLTEAGASSTHWSTTRPIARCGERTGAGPFAGCRPPAARTSERLEEEIADLDGVS